jgi:hypothetical protein
VPGGDAGWLLLIGVLEWREHLWMMCIFGEEADKDAA